FYKTTQAKASHLEKALIWTQLPLLQIVPAIAAFVDYAGEGRLILSQISAEFYEKVEDGLLGPRACVCESTNRPGDYWDSLEIDMVRGLALWGCDLAKIDPANDEWVKRSWQFVDAVFGSSRVKKDYRRDPVTAKEPAAKP